MTGPLALPGLTVERLLGAGAFADVYLYRQELPRRRVAVKIMRAPVTGDSARAAFETEANLLAAVSTHPSIVTIHHAAIAENGHPYLIMEYCSRPGLAEQVRTRPLPVPEVLQTMIRLSGAVETAHRVGILHRDLKPANVLTTDYGWPALSDFGISSVAGQTTGGGAMSVPWAAPDVVAGHPYQRTSDVYALAATAFTLLAGVSPFELGGVGELPALVARILSAPVPDVPRSDVPGALQRVLQVAMSKDPTQRPQSASEFARGLQRIEQDLNLPTTHLDVPAGELEDRDEEAEATRLSARPDAAPSTPRPGIAAATDPDDRTQIVRRAAAEPDADVDDRTSVTRRPAAEPDAEPDDRTRVTPRPAAEPDDRTHVVRRSPAAVDDRTSVVHRAPAAGPDDRTHVARRPGETPEDRTVLRAPAPSSAPPASAPPAPTSRRAYDPGAQGTPASAYGIRDRPATVPVHRATPSAPPPPSPTQSAASRGRARGRLRLRLILLAIGTVLLLAATVGGIIVLTATG